MFWLLLIVVILVPLIFLLIASFAGTWPFPRILPASWSLRSWKYVASNMQGIAHALGSSALYSLGAALITALFCWLPAQFLARHTFRGQTILEALLLTPALVPAITFSMGLQVLFIRLHLADSIVGVVLILTLVSYPYMLRSIKTGYLAYKVSYDECARNLGIGELQRLWHVELPLVLPAFLSGGTIVFLVAFSEYFLVFLIGGGTIPSFPGYLVPFLTGSDRAVASTLTLLFLLVPFALFLLQEIFLERFYRRKGITMTGKS
ncbi:MAG: ABC transporter permease subunit [Spirochaetia bacterium]|nr:ABC transporter permease subunit [Spirochaetia bacterium]